MVVGTREEVGGTREGTNKEEDTAAATKLAILFSKSLPVLTSGFLGLNISSPMRAAIFIPFVPLGHVHVWVTDCEKLYSWSVLCTISAASRVHYPFSLSPCPVLHMYVYSLCAFAKHCIRSVPERHEPCGLALDSDLCLRCE